MFQEWKKYFDNEIELIPIELAGRGKRFNNPLYNTLEEAVDDVLKQIQSCLVPGDDYALFGHSMGGLIVFEICYKLKEIGMDDPLHVFFSGISAPHKKMDTLDYKYLLPDDEFLMFLEDLGGTPKECLENDALMEIFIPIIKADYKLVETYKFNKKIPLNYDISVIYGNRDDMQVGDIEEWKIHTTKQCRFFEFDGGHFFIQPFKREVIQVIKNVLHKQRDWK